MRNTRYQTDMYIEHERDDRIKDMISKSDKKNVKKAVQKEITCNRNFFEKNTKLDRKEANNDSRTYRKRPISPYYKNFYQKATQKRYSTYKYDKMSKEKISPYERHSPLSSISRGSSPSISQDRAYNSRSRYDDVKERQSFNKTPHSRFDSPDSYDKSQGLKYYSSRREYSYSPEYFKDRHYHNTLRHSFSSSFENKRSDYHEETHNHGNDQSYRHSVSFSASDCTHSSYNSKYGTNHYNSGVSFKEKYKRNRLSPSYQENPNIFSRISYTTDSHQKHAYTNNSRDSKHSYVCDRDLHYDSPFSNELDENNLKEADIIYKSPKSCVRTDNMVTKTRNRRDAIVVNSHMIVNIVEKQNDTADSHYSENIKQCSSTSIVSFKLLNPKTLHTTPHVHLENVSSDLNAAFSSYSSRTRESVNKSTLKDPKDEVKSSKRSLDPCSTSVNNKDTITIKKSKKSPRSISSKDSKNSIAYSEQNNILAHSKDLDLEKNVPVIKPITKITMIDSKEGYVYERIGQVGEGTYGKVYKARNRITNELVALKKIRMEYEKNGFPITAMREIKLLQSLKHPNVVCLLEMMVEKSTVYMVFEYMDHDLSGVLSNPDFQFELSHTKHLCKQMLDGLEYLHHRGILHRSNILLDNFGQLKLADFGLARYYHKKRDTVDYTNRVITLWFRPPELLLGATAYGPSADIWSAGCIMIELFTKKPLFPGHDEIHQLELIYDMMGTPTHENWPTVDRLPWYELLKPSEKKTGKFYDNYSSILSPAALNLISNILALDPSKRPTAAEALKHTFFTQEEPRPEPPLGLGNMKGDWHEYESKRRRKKLKENKVDRGEEIERNIVE
ncbi:hypothetical protein PCANB_002516 [Pneumocystis canis]|nr:hypothetical protein PCANB_002516 [Pneumocystis canis]